MGAGKQNSRVSAKYQNCVFLDDVGSCELLTGIISDHANARVLSCRDNRLLIAFLVAKKMNSRFSFVRQKVGNICRQFSANYFCS